MLEYVCVNVLVIVLGLVGAFLLKCVIFRAIAYHITDKVLTNRESFAKTFIDTCRAFEEEAETYAEELDKRDEASKEQKGENDEDEDDYVLPF